MKKLLYLLTIVFAFSGMLRAQNVAYYKLSSTVDATYADLTGATEITALSSLKGTDFYKKVAVSATEYSALTAGFVQGIPLPFTFKYHGEDYNKIVVSSNGFMTLGKDSVSLSGFGSINFMVNNSIGLTYGNMWEGAVGRYNTKVSYKTEGTAPNQKFILEFQNLGYTDYENVGHTTSDSISFQICLYETSNKIDIWFKSAYIKATSGFCIGLRNFTTHPADIHFVAPKANDWSDPKSIFSTTATAISGKTFPNALKFTFEMPDVCVAPVKTAASIEYTSVASHGINGKVSFPADIDADAYLIVGSPTAELTSLPQNDEIYPLYTSGDYTKIGNGVVAAVGDMAAIVDFKYGVQYTSEPYNQLEEDTRHYIHVFTYNYRCTGAKSFYNTTTVFKADTVTRAEIPAELKITEINKEHIKLTGTTNSSNEDMLVAYSTLMGKDHNNNNTIQGEFGKIEGDYQVGDPITSNGVVVGKVIYVGKTTDNIVFDNIEANTMYHFGAFSRKASDGKWSTSFAYADTITYAKTPFTPNFNVNTPSGLPLYGWKGEVIPEASSEGFYTGTNQFKLDITKGTESNPNIAILETPEITFDPANPDLRMVFSYNATIWFSRISVKLSRDDWSDKDSINIQISIDGGDYVTAYSINKTNADEFSNASTYVKQTIPFTGIDVSGKTGRIRIVVKNEGFSGDGQSGRGLQMVIQDLVIEATPSCEYPTKPSVAQNTATATGAEVSWTNGAEEALWNIRYREILPGQKLAWSQALPATANPFMVEGLASGSILELQVQAVCAQDNLSPWSDLHISNMFQTAPEVPFVESFDRFTGVYNVADARKFPYQWSSKQILFEETTTMSGATSGYANVDYAKGLDAEGYAIKHSYQNAGDEGQWVLTPVLDLGNDNVHYALSFDLSLRTGCGSDTAFPALSSINDGAILQVAISTDGGATFKQENILATWAKSDMAELLVPKFSKEIDLTAYSGEVQVGFYIFTPETTDQCYEFYIDNVAFLPTCEPVRNLEISDVRHASAIATWTNASDATSWLLGFSEVGETPEISVVSDETKDFIDLTERTDYVVRVTNVCAPGDTAKWVTKTFTTTSEQPCDAVSGIVVSEISKTSAKISWTADAFEYKVRFRPSGATDWIFQTATDTSLVLSPLSMGVTYEYGIQTICSRANGDTSSWTATDEFTTDEQTCFLPTNVASKDVDYKSAKITWEGTSASYQVAYKKTSETAYSNIVNTTEKTVTLTELTVETAYQVRLRGICGEGDTTLWMSTPLEFTTAAKPICGLPTNLNFTDANGTSVKLTWDEGENNVAWISRHRVKGSTDSWILSAELTEKFNVLSDLTANTAYVWSVQAKCGEFGESNFATQTEFNSGTTAVKPSADQSFQIYAADGLLHILNSKQAYIDRIEIYGMDGSLLKKYEVRDNLNVTVQPNLHKLPVVISIYGQQDETPKHYKVFIN